MTTTTLDHPAAVAHTRWCCEHIDSGPLDQLCRTAGWALRTGSTPGVDLELHRYSARDNDGPIWVDSQLTVQVHVEQDCGEGFADLTLAEARQLAVALLTLVEVAETQTGWCPR